MNAKLIVGVIILIIGLGVGLIGYTAMQEYQTTGGQLTRVFSEEAQQEYQTAVGMTCFGGIFFIIGIILTALGVKQSGGESKKRKRRCVECGREIPFNAKICPYCRHDYSKKEGKQKEKRSKGK